MHPSANDTENLVAGLKARDRQAYAALYDNYGPALYGIIHKMVNNEATAEDLMQDCLVKVWKSIHSYDAGRGAFFTWLLNIARYTTIDYLRSKGFKQQQKIYNADLYEYTHENQVSLPDADRVGLKSLVQKLDPKYQKIIDLVYFWGYTQEEVSGILEIPLGTVKSRTRHALNELRSFFATHEYK